MYKITVPTVITNGHFNREKTLAELKRCGAERIALALERELEYSFSSPDNLVLLNDLVQYFHDNGLEVIVWLGETFGHGVNHMKSKYTEMRAFKCTGEIDEIGALCPTDSDFIADFCTWVKNVAYTQPDMIMLDDDFRLSNRGGYMGCCCEGHMQMIREKLGEKIEASQLKDFVLNGGTNKYKAAWLNSQKQSMERFAEALRKALDSVNPKISLGFCACTGSWGQEGWNAVELSRIMAGSTKPFLRTIGAPYWAAVGANGLGEVIEIERSQLGKMPDGEVFVEGDTYPRPRSVCPAAFLECYDMIIRADGRADGILKYMLDYVSDADYETGYVDAMVNNKKVYGQIEELFCGATCTGVKPYFSESVNDILPLFERHSVSSPEFKFIAKNSLQSTYEDGFVNIVFGEHARYISEAELKNGSIIDMPAAKILTERGIDVGIKEFLPELEYCQTGFSDVPQEYFCDEDIYVRVSDGLKACRVITADNARTVTEILYGHGLRLVGDFEYENAQGMKFRVLNIDAAKAAGTDSVSSYAKRRSIVKSVRWLGKALCVYPDGNYPELYVLAKEKEGFICAGFWNLCRDKIENMRINIESEFKAVRFINCTGHVENNTAVLDGTLYPYEFAGLEIKLY